MQAETSPDAGPLEGVRVLEITRFVSGPYAGQALADLGADVIKVEDPEGGDPFRSFAGGSYGPHFVAYNRNKRSICVDLKSPEGRGLVLRLCGNVDIVLENMRPGVMESFGLSYENLKEVNSAIIYCSLTGFGQTGEYARRPAYDTIAQAQSGMLSQTLNLEDPRIVGPHFADGIAGLTAANAILAALLARNRTGYGQHIDVPMVAASLSFLTSEAALFLNTGEQTGPSYRPSASQAYAFRCSDDAVLALHLSSPEKFWRSLTIAIERPDLLQDERFASRGRRIENYEELNAVLAGEFSRRTRSDWLQRLGSHDIPHAPVLTLAEVFDDPQVRHLEMVLEVEHPDHGTVRTVSPPARFSATPTGYLRAPPALGADTESVIAELRARDPEG